MITWGLAVMIGLILSKVVKPRSKKLLSFLKSLSLSLGSAVAANEYIKAYTTKHESLFSFLKKRLTVETYFGLPLTLLAGAFLYVLFLFLGIIEDILSLEPIVAADQRFNKLMILFRSPVLIKIFLGITSLGRAPIIISLALIFSILFWLWKKREYLAPFWLSIIGSVGLNMLGKIAFHRLRPINPVYLETTYSFPSGHATAAIAIYGFLFYFFWKLNKKISAKIVIFMSGLTLALLIGFSRLYLGVHYLSDVLEGYLLGLLWLIIGISLVEWQIFNRKNIIFKQNSVYDAHLSKKGVRILTSVLIISELAFLTLLIKNYQPSINLPVPAQTKIIIDELSVLNDFSLPRYTETIDASSQEPLSFLILSQDDQSFINAFKRAGWSLADPVSSQSIKEIIQAAFLNNSYSSAPMTPSFWNGEVHNFGFEKPTKLGSVRQRHHARFWKTNLVDKTGKNIYVGTASYDSSLKWGITHKIAPDIDTERELLFADLKQIGQVKNFKKWQFVPPNLGQNFSGDLFFTDGQIYTLDLN